MKFSHAHVSEFKALSSGLEGLQLRAAHRHDVPNLLPLAHALHGKAYQATTLQQELQLAWSHVWIMQCGAACWGYMLFWHIADELQLHDLLVVAAQRRQGRARWMLRTLLQWAATHAVHTLTLEVRASNRAAQALYSSMGWRVVGRRPAYYSAMSDTAAEDALLYQLSLRSPCLCLV